VSERKKKKKKKDKERERETEDIHEHTTFVAVEDETREERKKRKKEKRIKPEPEQSEEEQEAAADESSLVEEEKLALLRDVELSFGKSRKKHNKNKSYETPTVDSEPEQIIKLELSLPKKSRVKASVKPEPVIEQVPTPGASKKSKTVKQQLVSSEQVSDKPLSKEFCDDSSSSASHDTKPSEQDLEEKRQQLLNSIALKQLGRGTPKKKNKKKDVEEKQTETAPVADKSKKKKKKGDEKQNETVDMAPSFLVPTSTPAPKIEEKSGEKKYDSSKDSLIKDMMMKYQKKSKKSKKSK
jgi:hypothetical protein